MDLGLKGKVAMVAGASKGLGFAVARQLALEGARVSMASSNEESITIAGRKIEEETSARILAVKSDLRSADDITKWLDVTLSTFGGVDSLFVSGGGPPAGEFLTFDDTAWQSAFELLALSSIRLPRAVIPSMRSRGGGSILFSTSSSVKEPNPDLVLSNVLRSSVSALAKTLSRELAPFKIRVNQIVPGRIDTDRLRSLDTISAEKSGVAVEEIQKRSVAAIPLGRYGQPEEFARAAVFLISDAASYVTGATLQVDGGMIKSVL